MKEISIKYYTIQELKDWLFDNFQNGLNEKIISKVRAYAFVSNPNAQDNDIVLVVAFISENVVGYTAMFAEEFSKPKLDGRYYWGSTLFVDPNYRGKGIGKLIMKSVMNSINYKYLGLDSSDASVGIDKKQGSQIFYYDRYAIKYSDFRKKTGLWLVRYIIKKTFNNFRNLKFANKIFLENFENEYINFIDKNTYEFISNNSSQDMFLRSQDTFNWILKFPFIINTPLTHRQKKSYEFLFAAESFYIHAVKVLYKDKLIGIYFLREREKTLSLLYLYYLPEYSHKVFWSIAEHIVKMKAYEFRTFNSQLPEFLLEKGLHYIKKDIEKISLTVPSDFIIDANLKIQGGDGDVLV